MKSLILLSSAAVLELASAQDIDGGDYPLACYNYCAPVAARSNQCDRNTNDDGDEIRCLCNGNGMSTAIPRCAACVVPFRIPGEDDYNDIDQILSACSLSTTSLANAPTPTTTIVVTTTSVDDDDTEVETITSFGASLPSGVTRSVYTTTSTDDDGGAETEVETTTIISGAAASVSSAFVVTTTSNGEVLTQTKVANPTGVAAASSSSSSDNAAMRTAAPMMGAAAIAMGALAAL